MKMNINTEAKIRVCRERLLKKAEIQKELFFSRKSTEERLQNQINLKRLRADFTDIRADIGRKKIPYGFIFTVPTEKEKAVFMLSGRTGNTDTTLRVRAGFDSGIVTAYEVVGSQHLKDLVYEIAARWSEVKVDLDKAYQKYLGQSAKLSGCVK